MDVNQIQEFAGWIVAGAGGAILGVRKLMTLWSSERATATKSGLETQKAQAEIDVISLLRAQLEMFVKDSQQRMQDQAQMRKLIDDQAHELRELHSLVTRLHAHVNRLGELLQKNGITPPEL